MQKLVNNKIVKLLLIVLLSFSLFSCKKIERYKVEDYLSDLAYDSGIWMNQDAKESFEQLKSWNVVKEEERTLLNDYLNYGYLSLTLSRFFDEENIHYLKENNYLSNNVKDSALVDKEEAQQIMKEIVRLINNPSFKTEYYIDEKEEVIHLNQYHNYNDQLICDKELQEGDFVYLNQDDQYYKIVEVQEHGYRVEDITIEDVINNLYLSGSNEINFEEAIIIPGDGIQSLAYEETNYVNHSYTLLASKQHSFSKDGFKITYSFKSSGIDARITRKIPNGPNLFFDISLSNLKPTYKWDYQDGELKEAFLKLDFKLTNELGVSIGKYDDYYIDLKNLDAKGFSSAIKKNYDYKSDELEATIKICTIQTKIPGMPLADFNIDVVAKMYASGKIEIALYNEGTIGFEIKDGNFRTVHDVEKDSDFIIGASARAVAGLNFNLGASKFRLMDVEFDAGIRAAVSSTLHLYDNDGIASEETLDIPYSILSELSKENPNIYVCGDVSLNWVFDLQFNTSKTFLYKYGLTYKKSFLNQNNQVFGNLTHIENWQFVKKCTRKNKTSFKTSSSSTTNLNTNKIVLSTYSKVIVKNENMDIPIVSLPNGYEKSDLVYESSDTNIANCINGIIETYETGACSITIKTKDNKYKASINILVSTG